MSDPGDDWVIQHPRRGRIAGVVSIADLLQDSRLQLHRGDDALHGSRLAVGVAVSFMQAWGLGGVGVGDERVKTSTRPVWP